ncbi:formimidoylglutamate deiminase [Pinirhizobacter soli]|uniref:formimidoylglutamate deiminase n=1 Tax=Pinirhizobacter soli TaxID=2786953 RepID=UPI00202A75A6|nr:formimidoylglutamate deiminase [Pinirhizobacter soli]
MSTSMYRADHAWQGNRWTQGMTLGVRDGRLAIDGQTLAGGPSTRLGKYVLPGMPNLHSHAFQRAMAGMAERRGPGDDSFWTWREAMYGFAQRIGPDDLKAIAAQLYVEMLKAGYTHVCEFHYLHHQPDGSPWPDPGAMSHAIAEAAEEAGIGLTLLPVLYMTGGFDGRPLGERQRRFGHTVDAYLRLVDSLRAGDGECKTTGVALHSLRAVQPDAIHAVLGAIARDMPVHIHIAEQVPEVDECLAVRGCRPVQWLLDNVQVDARWCLVHATHLDAGETRGLAQSGAVVGLCPTTEANLGDGLFPLASFIDQGGVLGIGSDSHISVSPVEELRWLEYGQRLVARQRNVAARHAGQSVGESLFARSLAGGAAASGTAIGTIATGARADLVVLDDASPVLAARDAGEAMDSFIFSGNVPLVRDVMVGGRWVVRGGQHVDQSRIADRYRRTVERLKA